MIGFIDLVVHLNYTVHVDMFEHLCELLSKREISDKELTPIDLNLEKVIENTECSEKSNPAVFDIVVSK